MVSLVKMVEQVLAKHVQFPQKSVHLPLLAI